MLNPFSLFGRLLLAGVRVTGYGIVFLVQMLTYIVAGRRDKIGDAIGDFGRGTVDAFVGVFKR
jgi:hypothetical protein